MSEVPASEAVPTKKGFWARIRERDHTQGSLFKSLLTLALPLVATSLCGGVVFQLVDLKLISGMGDQAVTAVVVTNQSLRQLFFMLVMGGSFGAQALIARAAGQRDPEASDYVAGQTILLGLCLSVIIALLGLGFSKELLSMMNVSPNILEIGKPYVKLVFMLSFGFIFMNLFNAILNGAGDTTTPFLITIISTFTSLLAEWALIYGHLGLPALGIRGVALGLGTGQTISILFMAYVLLGGASRIHVRRRHIRPNWALLRQLGKLAWPPGLQMLGGFVVTVFFIRFMGDFGDKAQAAYSIGLRLSMLVPMICFPLAGAVATLVGQALGAGKTKRAWKAIWVGLLVNGIVMWSLSIPLYLFREPLLRLFTQDVEVIAIGESMLAWQAASYALLAFSFVFFRALQGAGDMFVPMALSLVNSIGITIPLGIYLTRTLEMGPQGLFIAQFATTVLGTVVTGAWLATGRWTRIHLQTHGTPS
ncbi:MAG: MATE family efflux transporter [Myxococcota bacterium]|nr:MATE family efflux transporter [Myxococcota bacterium]